MAKWVDITNSAAEPWLGIDKSIKINYLINEAFGNKQTEGPSQEFYKILGVCFNTVHAVFLGIFGYIQKVPFYNIDSWLNELRGGTDRYA